MTYEEEDKVHRPDAYICKSCGLRFNVGKKETVEEDGVFFTRTVCPRCGSAEIVISWWVEKGGSQETQQEKK